MKLFGAVCQAVPQLGAGRTEGRDAVYNLHVVSQLPHTPVNVYVRAVNGRVAQRQIGHVLSRLQLSGNLLRRRPVGLAKHLSVLGHGRGELKAFLLVQPLHDACGDPVAHRSFSAGGRHGDHRAFYDRLHRKIGHQPRVAGTHADAV